MDRRSFLRGLVAAPAVVSFASLMPVRGLIMPTGSYVWIEPPFDIDLGVAALNRVYGQSVGYLPNDIIRASNEIFRCLDSREFERIA